ncbi:organic cation transporter protein [Aplysia californica]|uniref:Organic cation transporter protein n=1 Tax=Aplysia californica TaxID=6500 RepID=A0ABM1AEV7_APLCA|nr:organic cation transporter protein [Aplysia californica]
MAAEKDPNDVEFKRFDDLLLKIGHFGRFQKLMLIFIAVISFVVGYQNVSSVFTLNIPKHRCQIPGLPNDTYLIQSDAHLHLINESIPLEPDGEYSECNIFENLLSGNSSSANSSRPQKTCSSWVYDKTVFERTLTTDLNLVCGNKIFRSHSNMLMFAGKFLGAISQGFASDKFGRRRVVIATAAGILVGSIGHAFVSDLTTLFIFRFIIGMMTTAHYLALFVLVIEYMDPKHRTIVSLVNRMSFTLTQMSLIPIAYLQNDWQVLQTIIIWPSVLLFLVIWFIPESSRWLVAKNKRGRAEKIVQRAARINRVKLPQNVMSELQVNSDRTSVSPWPLFNNPKLCVRWAVIYSNWFVISMTYYGLTLNVSNMGGNIFLNFFLTVIVDFVASTTTGLLAEKFSRKRFHITVLTIGGCACAASFIPVITGGNKWIVIAVSMVGKMGISSAYFLIYQLTAELFPTTYRAFGLGSSSMVARIGGIASPYIADLNTYVQGPFGEVLPQLVFGGAGIVGGLLALLLPDTRNRKLPETIADAVNYDQATVVTEHNNDATKETELADSKISEDDEQILKEHV